MEKSGGGELQPVGAVVMYASDRPAVCSNFIARMPVADGYSPEFLRYLHATLYSARVNIRSIKQSIGIQNLDSGAYLDELAGLPPLPEQWAIAVFLDRETARVDALVEHKERLIALLEEKRQTVISHAVEGQSTNPTVRLKHFADILPGFAFPSVGFSRELEDVRLFRGTNVMPGGTDWTDVVRWPKHDIASYRQYELRAGDIVFGMDRPWIKSGIRVARITEEDLPCLLLQRVARLRATDGLSQDYLELILGCKQFAAYFEPILTGVSVPHISPEQILDFRFRLPTPADQAVICRQLVLQFATLKDLALRIRDGIARLQEYRTALISAAVTGQIDVRGEV
jgi:type I restriction enzyme S subunit